MADKQLVVAVEATAAMGPFWQTILHDYLDKIIRSFCGTEVTGQKLSSPNVQLSLVTFNTRGSYSAYLVGRSGWTRDIDTFFQWLSAISFAGGGFNDVAIAEGLADALMMLCGSQGQQNVDNQKHCILVAASNPYPLPTPVFRPQLKNLEKIESMEGQPESRLFDAEAIAKFFAQLSVSLSIICPKQLPKLKAIYNSGKRNPRAADPPIDTVKNPYYLVLISENFLEARATLIRPGTNANLASNHSPVKMDITSVPTVSSPPSVSIPLANGSAMNRQQPVSVGINAPATVKVEPTTMTPLVPGPAFQHIPSVPRPISQGVPSLQTSSPLPGASQEMLPNNDSIQDLKPTVSGITQSMRPVGPAAANVSILNNLSTARQVMNSATLTGGSSIGLQSIGGPTPMAIHMSNMISTGMASSVPATQPVLSSGQPGIMGGSGTLAGTSQIAQNSAAATFASGTSNMSQAMGNIQVGGGSMGQPVPSIMAQAQGNLPGGQMVQGGIGLNQNMMSGMSSSGTMMPTPGMGQQGPGMLNNNTAANMPLPQQTSSALQSAQSKYVKVWEGNLSGQRQGQPVFITRLEGYRSASASETLAANWPTTMQIVRLISQDHMNNKQYVGKADFLVFRAMNQHGFLGQLQEKKLCAVIQLPSQTLLLSVSDKACRLIGMLFPGDMVVFKPQISSQQQQTQQHPQLQQQQLQQLQQQQQQQQQSIPQLQQQQQMPQQQQMQQQQQQQQQQMPQQMQQQQMPQQMQQQQQQMQQPQQQQHIPQMQQLQQQQQHIPQMQQPQQQQQQQMGQGYVQGPSRSSQGQVSSQAPPPIMPGGGGYLN